MHSIYLSIYYYYQLATSSRVASTKAIGPREKVQVGVSRFGPNWKRLLGVSTFALRPPCTCQLK